MATQYTQVKFDISPKQRKSIADAVSTGSTVRLKLTHKQLMGKKAMALVTKTQYNRINKAKQAKKGIMLTLSKKQIEKMKSGGFLPALLGALASTLIPTIFNRIFPDRSNENSGSGIMPPGMKQRKTRTLPQIRKQDMEDGEGIMLPGSGMGRTMVPYNGTNTQYHINAFTARNAGEGNAGNGIMLPGKGVKMYGSKTAKKYMGKKNGMGVKQLEAPKKKRQKMLGMGTSFINPNSETYQLLE